uniref:BTB domain-containing protein n=1 Tax=Denticeps clupeoides TaxID=299321 RepID=A0AAY4A7C7_9TELE
MSYFLMLSKSHGADVLSRFQQLRVAGRMCDVVLEAGGVEFPAHRALLACSSDYFWSLFQEHTLESKAWNLSLPALCPAGLEQVLDFIYCSWLSVCPSTLEDILVAASYLQVTSATELCSRYMADSLSLNNCCFFANVAARHGLTERSTTCQTAVGERAKRCLMLSMATPVPPWDKGSTSQEASMVTRRRAASRSFIWTRSMAKAGSHVPA